MLYMYLNQHISKLGTTYPTQRMDILLSRLTAADLEITQILLRNEFGMFSPKLLRNYLDFTQITYYLLINLLRFYLGNYLGFTQDLLRMSQNTQKLLRNYLGSTQKTLRIYLGNTQELLTVLRIYLESTQELLSNYLVITQ